MNVKTIFLALFSIVLLAACGTNSEKSEDVRALVDDYSAGNFTDDQQASITSSELIITNEDESEETYDLPDDEFFISIAPFKNETHPCEIHSLTGCQGELVDADFDMIIKNQAGEIVVDETINSGKNGFVDLWLPRDETYNVEVQYDEQTVESEISTFEGDRTCITTMQLS